MIHLDLIIISAGENMGSKRSSSNTLGGFESELNSIVKEYLEFCGYNRTSTAFESEARENGKTLAVLPPKSWDKNKADMQSDLLTFFRSGNRREFFGLWDDNVPESVRTTDPICKKLEFYLNIYFAIFPIKYQLNTGKKSKVKLEDAMTGFKSFLETKGAALSQTTEFLPFYALPFVPDPTKHPSYKELFAENWIPDLQTRLEKFLALTLPAQAQPRLFEIYQDINSKNSGQMQKFQQNVVDAERRTMTYIRRYNKIQADYHNLIGITAELVDTLESCISGNQVTPDYLQSVCQRLFSNQLRESVDVTRPPTANSLLKASFAQYSPIIEEKNEDVPLLPSLDYDHIKKDLVSAETREKALLLQALRWRLTRSESGEQRDTVILAYVQHDLLGCKEPSDHRVAILKMLVDSDEVVQQYLCRLFNGFASLSVGRAYLGSYPELVQALQKTLTSDERDPITRENALGTLQKLSLKRHLQTCMIESGIISWLVQILEDSDALSDYTLEYSVALLMNLCLRTQGKKTCGPERGKVLKVLSDLLGHEDQEIRPYVNGTLYSILSVPEIRNEARAMGMEEILKCFVKEDSPEMNRQLQFIIKQLNSEIAMDDTDSDDEEEDDEEDQDQDAMEADLDKAEIINPRAGELVGEKLLTTEYLGIVTSARSERGQEPSSRQGTAMNRESKVATPHEVLQRPSTRSGSRGSNRGDGHSRLGSARNVPDVMKVDHVGVTQSLTDQDIQSQPQRSDKTARSAEGRPKPPNERTNAFGSRPKIPRTPDGESRAASRSITSPGPPPRSASPSRGRTGNSERLHSAKKSQPLPPVESVEVEEINSNRPASKHSALSSLSSVSLKMTNDTGGPTSRGGSRLNSVQSDRSKISPGDDDDENLISVSQQAKKSAGRARTGKLSVMEPVNPTDPHLTPLSQLDGKPLSPAFNQSASSRRQGSASSRRK
ncbi:lisH domain-containing protein ARMC9-like isoform X3 [Apostichopus japonicus]|uniref:lisH domain-containing protein ARMC9-like isoform X3 n=1 Tax=Stichopus japonicus TaxID=307972 RepID=UPI003AB4F3EE